jgi:hypothetical protein
VYEKENEATRVLEKKRSDKCIRKRMKRQVYEKKKEATSVLERE